MSFIEDGKGRGYKASVSSSNRLNVSAKSNPRAYYNSRDEENCYSIGTSYTAADGDYVFYIKNTDYDLVMMLTDITLSSAEVAKFTVEVVSGTASGTAVTPLNINIGSANTASVDCKGNAAVTGLTSTGTMHITHIGADDHVELHFMESMVVQKGQAVAIKYNGVGADVAASVMIFMEKHSSGVN